MIRESDTGFTYEVKTPEGRTWYEVFRKYPNPRFGTYSDPKSKSFGTWAWTKHSMKQN